MQTDQLVFKGSEAEQQLARDIWMAMRMLGASFGVNAPIRQSLTALARFFASSPRLAKASDPAALIDAALTKNDAIFAREKAADGEIFFATTRLGQRPAMIAEDDRHTFQSRLTVPPPLAPVEPPREVVPIKPVASVWLTPPSQTEAVDEDEEEDVTEAVAIVEPATEIAAPAISEAPADAPQAAVVQPAVAPEPTVAPPIAPVEFAVPDVVDPLAVSEALGERLAADPRLVNFGNEWYLDDLLLRLGRNDFRRIRDYINERNEPLTDQELLNDVLGRRPTDRDFQLLRFGLNVRMSREKKEFDFVGTPQARLWSIPSLAPIGTAKRKPAELGQDYRFLLEASSDAPAPAGGHVTHTITFYEYEYGVLPLDLRLTSFFPAAFTEDQRVAVLRFEIPQLYVNYLVELRYPTANRGGFIGGLEQFYAENLVPGAIITIERGDNDGHYTIKFDQTKGEERRLLHLDERRGRFVFRPVTFYCVVNEDLLLSDSKFPGLNNAKPLDDRERRRPELVVRTTFERVGEPVEQAGQSRLYALFDDLLAAVNIERPFSPEYLRAVLNDHPEFAPEEGGSAYTYEPTKAQ